MSGEDSQVEAGVAMAAVAAAAAARIVVWTADKDTRNPRRMRPIVATLTTIAIQERTTTRETIEIRGTFEIIAAKTGKEIGVAIVSRRRIAAALAAE